MQNERLTTFRLLDSADENDENESQQTQTRKRARSSKGEQSSGTFNSSARIRTTGFFNKMFASFSNDDSMETTTNTTTTSTDNVKGLNDVNSVNNNNNTTTNNNNSKQIITILQPNPNKSNRKSTPSGNNERKASIISKTSKSSMLNNSNASESDLSSMASSAASATSQNDNNRYNISNLLKHIYTLKYSTQKSPQQQQQVGGGYGQSVSASTGQLNNDPSSAADNVNAGAMQSAANSLKQFWMPDDQVKECFECNEKFTTFRRRHHCRVCGQIFCGKCSDHEIPSQLIWPNTSGNIRACTFCHSFVGEMETGDIKNSSKSIRELMKRLSLPTSSFYSQNDSDSSTLGDLLSQQQLVLQQQLQQQQQQQQQQPLDVKSDSYDQSQYQHQDSLKHSPSSVSLNSQNSTLNQSLNQSTMNMNLNSSLNSSASLAAFPVMSNLHNEHNPFDVTENRDYFRTHDQDEIKQLIINNSSELRNLWVQIYHTSDGIQFQSKSINKFKKMNNCITGHELVEWLIKKKSVSKDQAIVIGQALVDGKWLECAYMATSNSSSMTSLTGYYSSQKFEQIFYDDNSLYKPGQAATNCNISTNIYDKKTTIQDNEEGPEWIKELNKLVTSTEDDASSVGVSSANQSFLSSELSSSNQSSSFTIIDISPNVNSGETQSLSERLLTEDKNSVSKAADPPLLEDTAHLKTDSGSSKTLKSASSETDVSQTSNSSDVKICVQSAEPILQSQKVEAPSTSVHQHQHQHHQYPQPPPAKKNLNDVNDHLQQIHKQFQIEILKQLLKLRNLSFDWFDIIISLVWQCVHLVRPDVKHDNDSMDIRSYIKIKKLTVGSMNKSDSRIINGLVFTKNIAHKKMKCEIRQPKILLLRSSIEYQRTEEKMCSLDPILTAETQYLKNYCSKLQLRHSPDILIVEKSVARTAQECFLQSGTTLVLNIKSTIMDKLCRFLQADPMYSIDDPIRKPKLGFCSKFYVENYRVSPDRVKSLMFFDGTPTNLGCTILLTGASLNELTIVKSLIRFMIYVAYNSKLEQSFILDKYADFNLKNTMFDVKNDETYMISNLNAKETENKKKQPETNTKTKVELAPAAVVVDKSSALSNTCEISIDQSPLEVKFTNDDDDDDEDDDHEQEEENQEENHPPLDEHDPNSTLSTSVNYESVNETKRNSTIASQNSIARQKQDDQLKLTICEQHKEKLNLYRNFKLLVDDLILSCSPLIKFQLPLLLVENIDDPLKKYLPPYYMNYLKSSILLGDTSSTNLSGSSSSSSGSSVFSANDTAADSTPGRNNLHEFLLVHLTKSFDDDELKKLYADFKSRGGIAASPHYRRLILKQIETQPERTATDKALVVSPPRTQFDCLDIFNRQQLAVLFYSQCESSPVYPNICHKPRVINMRFYGENDMTLGSFLVKNCFRNGYKCNNELCETLIVYHTRTFVHSDSKITIRMSIVPTANPNPATQQTTQHQQSTASNAKMQTSKDDSNNGNQSTISNNVSSTNQFSNLNVTALTAMSYSGNKPSTANSKLGTQQSSPNLNGSGQILSIASMVPSSSASSTSVKTNDANNLKSPSPSTTSQVQLAPQQQQQSHQQQPQQPPQQHQQPIYDDINIFMWSVCKICNKSTKKIAMSPDTWSYSLAKFFELTFHARNYHQFNSASDDHAECKHSLFQDHYQYFRFRNVVTVFSTSKIVIKSLQIPELSLKSPVQTVKAREEYIEEIKDLYEKGLSLFLTLVERISSLKESITLNDKQLQKLDQYVAQINSDQTLRHKIECINLLLTKSSRLMSQNGLGNFTTLTTQTPLEASPVAATAIEPVDIDQTLTTDNNNPNSDESTRGSVDYYTIDMYLLDLRKYIANNVQLWNTRMSEFLKKSNKFDDATGHTSNDQNPTITTQPSTPIEIPKSVQKSFQMSYKDDECTVLGKQQQLLEPSNEIGTSLLNESPNPKYLTDQVVQPTQDDKLSALQLGKRLIANLIPSSAYQPLRIPFSEEEHYLLSTDSTYYVNDKYLTSIIAFSLCSKEYKEFQAVSSKLELSKLILTSASSIPFPGSSSQQEIDEFDSNQTGKSSGLHFQLQFYDSTTKFYCKAYYAELFARLRKLIMPNEEEKYIHSLFQCVNWDAKGGKSNSQFRKTFDNRFVIKEMSKQEYQSFLEFAPYYIQYITDCIQKKKATAFVKIVGAYRICLMKSTTISSKAVKIDVIVMENLFYSKKCTQVFDLKGSERNRLVNVQNQSSHKNNHNPEKDLVLLDENFLRWSFDNPLYIKPHSKYVLMKAIENDSHFLSSRFIMDYSLLCGIDLANNDIIVGIIDYLRVFTWDKKVETYIKTIGGQGKMPTIVSPEVYRTRFINAIDRYFLEVPDQWYYHDISKNSNDESQN